MFEFKINYFFEKYHTGEVNREETRAAKVKAENREEAIKKIKAADDSFIEIQSLSFSEIYKAKESKQ